MPESFVTGRKEGEERNTSKAAKGDISREVQSTPFVADTVGTLS